MDTQENSVALKLHSGNRRRKQQQKRKQNASKTPLSDALENTDTVTSISATLNVASHGLPSRGKGQNHKKRILKDSGTSSTVEDTLEKAAVVAHPGYKPVDLAGYASFPKLLHELKSSHPAPNTTFPFFKLSGELRNKIYEYALVIPEGFDFIAAMYDGTQGKQTYKQARNHLYHKVMEPRVKLLRVCRQIHSEARSYFYARNEWKFVGDDGWVILYFWLKRIGINNRRLVQNITIMSPFTEWGDYNEIGSGVDRRWVLERLRRMGLKPHSLTSHQIGTAVIRAMDLLEAAGTTRTGPVVSMVDRSGLRNLRLVMRRWNRMVDYSHTDNIFPPDEFEKAVQVKRFPFHNRGAGHLPCDIPWVLLQRLPLKLPGLSITLVKVRRQTYLVAPTDQDHPSWRSQNGEPQEVHLRQADVIARARALGWGFVREIEDKDGNFPVKDVLNEDELSEDENDDE